MICPDESYLLCDPKHENNKYIILFFSTFKYFRQCQFVPHVRKCLPKSDGLSTVGDMLGDPVLRICVWIVAIITIVGNTLVLVGRVYLKEGNKAHVLTIGNLCGKFVLS